MIECEECGEYFHPDDIKECPYCTIELCENCFEKHIHECISEELSNLID